MVKFENSKVALLAIFEVSNFASYWVEEATSF